LTKRDMKHCLTNSKHRHIGAKIAFCGLQNTPDEFQAEAQARLA